MAVDSMNKVIHAAVRRDLARLDAALASAGDGDRARAADLHRAWVFLRDTLDKHHRQEEELIFPAVVGFGVDPALIATMESEHGAMMTALGDIDAALTSYAGSGGRADADAAGEAVRRGSDVVERHLAHEEAELEPAIAPYLGTDGWKAVEKQLRKQPPGEAGWFFAWLRDGGSPEAQQFLASTVPRPVLTVLSRIFGRGYHRTIAPVWR
jgi:hemerythrin-like domain-containing protein